MRVCVMIRRFGFRRPTGGIDFANQPGVVGVFGNPTLAENAMRKMYPDILYDEYGSRKYENHYYTIPDERHGQCVFVTLFDQEIIET